MPIEVCSTCSTWDSAVADDTRCSLVTGLEEPGVEGVERDGDAGEDDADAPGAQAPADQPEEEGRHPERADERLDRGRRQVDVLVPLGERVAGAGPVRLLPDRAVAVDLGGLVEVVDH